MRKQVLIFAAAAVALLIAGLAVGFILLPGPEATAGVTPEAPAAGRDAGQEAEQDAEREPDAGERRRAGQDSMTEAHRASTRHREATRGPEQPIPFSHRLHVQDLELGCDYCHVGTERSKVAVMPALSVCMGCHRTVGSELGPIRELREYWDRQEPVPWERIYKVPEFVQFHHQPHIRSGVECAECHGPVEEMDRVYRVQELSMGWCLTCHREPPREEDAATDYLLARQFSLPEVRTGREETGLYPRQLDSEYAAHRAPIDCATCHY